jgi:predicted MFS family arabinose efflux permease
MLIIAVATDSPWLVVPAVLATGLVGVTMNPALVARMHREGPAGTLVNTVHTSMITIGVALGSTLGAVGIEMTDGRAPLWVGFALAVLAALVMLPFARRSATVSAPVSAQSPSEPAEVSQQSPSPVQGARR